MKGIDYISTIAIPLLMIIILIYGIKEKQNVYELFIEGVKKGIKTVIRLFPTLLAIFIAIGMIRNSGVLDGFIKIINFFIKNNNFPSEVLPLAILKPISGSASLAMATDIMKNYGVDSKIGKIAATIMGSTETTLYIIAVYTNSIKIKKTRFILAIALISDFVGIIASIIICNIIG